MLKFWPKRSIFDWLHRAKKERERKIKHSIQSGFQKPISIFFERHVDQEGETDQEKDNKNIDDEFLDMIVSEKLTEGKQHIFFHSGQNNSSDKSCLDNNCNNYYDEIAYPFDKRI
jgi:hypothetical protein